MSTERTQEPSKDSFRIPVYKIEGISIEEYDKLSGEEQSKYEVRWPEKELELAEGVKNIRRKQKEIFINVMEIPEVEWIVEGFAVKQGITMVYGDGGVGKTSLMLDLMACINERGLFLGLTTMPASSLIIEQDENPAIMRSHVEKMLNIHPSLAWLKVPQNPVIWDNNQRDFMDSSLEQAIAWSSADLVIIDSLTSLGIDDINHPSCSIVFDRLRQMAFEWECAFIVIHHTNKSGEVMGSNLIMPKLDCMIRVESNMVIFEKLRGAPPNGSVIEAGKKPYLTVFQDPQTL